MRRGLFVFVVAIPLVAVLWYGLGHTSPASATPLLGKPAPQFSLRTLDGKRVSLASLRGHPVVLNFWASWCTDCKVEHPSILNLQRRYARSGVVFLGVSFQDSPSSARTWLEEHGGRWPDLEDPSQSTAIRYGVTGVPETFVIDRRGVLRYHAPGPIVAGSSLTPKAVSKAIEASLYGRA